LARELKPIVTVEDLDAKLRRVADELAESGRRIGEEARARLPAGAVFYSRETPKFAEEFIAEARRVLENELAIAEEVVGDVENGEDPIRPSERELEVAKRALVRLKLPQLRRLAIEQELDSRGGQLELVERVARLYQDDTDEVARLVLAYAEASPERGLVDRIYAVRETMPDLAEASIGFRALAGRYIRVGIARWFVFRHARIDNNGLWLEGHYRSYTADATREGDEFRLVSVPTDARVTARVREEQEFIEIRARGEAEGQAAIRALEWGTPLRHAPALPLNVHVSDGRLMTWDPRSVFMLDFLDRRLPDSGVEIINLTSAKFETAATETRRRRQPSVRAVALQGQHLLSSRAACELLVEGRGLVEVSLDVRFSPTPNASFIFPIRLGISPDHLSLLTGFGQHSPETAAELHRELARRVRSAISAGTTVDARLESLGNQIYERSESDEPTEADIFAPPQDWGDEDDEDIVRRSGGGETAPA
jgi:hypothetical protein